MFFIAPERKLLSFGVSGEDYWLWVGLLMCPIVATTETRSCGTVWTSAIECTSDRCIVVRDMKGV
jgi:hypothetical protein